MIKKLPMKWLHDHFQRKWNMVGGLNQTIKYIFVQLNTKLVSSNIFYPFPPKHQYAYSSYNSLDIS